MRAVGFVASWLFIAVFGSLFSGFVLTILWAWFIVPAFHVVQITIPQAIGISLVVGMLAPRASSSSDDKEKKKDPVDSLVTSFFVVLLAPLIALGVGAIVHAFV